MIADRINSETENPSLLNFYPVCMSPISVSCHCCMKYSLVANPKVQVTLCWFPQPEQTSYLQNPVYLPEWQVITHNDGSYAMF